MLDFQSVNKIDVDYKTAIFYLKKEAIYLENACRGYNLLCFEGVPLGWVKNVGNRCNNLYPAEWRIRMNIDKIY
jgi:NOL1/NOP2/fmu family ribosome biogenesis protein